MYLSLSAITFKKSVDSVIRKTLIVYFAGFLVCGSVSAMDPDRFYDVWGTEEQCSRQLLTPEGTKRAAPFDIRMGWLGHGDVWCRLNWGTVAPTEDGLFAIAQALCGEDSGRSYDVKFRLRGDQLTLVWNLWLRNGPLMRCER